MREVSLHRGRHTKLKGMHRLRIIRYKGNSLIRNCPPPRTTGGPKA